MIACCAAQSSDTSDKPAAEGPPHALPSPTNLKVLPKDLTGQQVHDIMKRWETDLGVRCDGCHKEDDTKLDRQGKPLLDFADDSKPIKNVARLMYTMTDDINKKYVANIEGSGLPVTCGTCHRGRVGPEPFTGAPQPAAQSRYGKSERGSKSAGARCANARTPGKRFAVPQPHAGFHNG